MGHADTHRPGIGRHRIGWGLTPREGPQEKHFSCNAKLPTGFRSWLLSSVPAK